jgi:hypothetical protein
MRTKAVMMIRNAATCEGRKDSSPFFISINELPHITARSNNKNQSDADGLRFIKKRKCSRWMGIMHIDNLHEESKDIYSI